MSSMTQLCRISNLAIGSYKSAVQARISCLKPIQLCSYTKKSAEEKLGIERPKRPLTPFFKFMTQMRPALLAKNPGITSKEAISWSSKHWQQLDVETKSQMTKEYEKDLEDYKKIKAIYESSLTDDQKADIQRVKEEMAEAKEKRKLKASRKDIFKGKQMKEYQEKIKVEWQKLPESEKAKFEKQAMELMQKYRKELDAWELKMVSLGRSDLVRAKPLREKKPASTKKAQ
ncbi:hypothetical protein MSG28_001364 [Choristoneura fumiferana]|uniref:Uncharacterized protein n=1 Tax=Choristoneura fumiferana TaxID=7141 RepID=A0ACC0KTW9_CHOFU|nr:hypothetical protein MSG28_001364 [Choristoneura fumiferana]